MFLSGAGVDQTRFTFWSVTQSLFVRYQATIQAFEEAFHMTQITLQLIKKPAIYGMILLFCGLPLVLWSDFCLSYSYFGVLPTGIGEIYVIVGVVGVTLVLVHKPD